MSGEDPIASVPSAGGDVNLPETAAWRHLGARAGFEVLFLCYANNRYYLDGHVTAVEEGEAWGIRYTLTLDSNWATRSARVVCRSARGENAVRLESDAAGTWRVDGESMDQLAGCLDVDLEASACTNALPVNRLRLEVGQAAEALLSNGGASSQTTRLALGSLRRYAALTLWVPVTTSKPRSCHSWQTGESSTVPSRR
jgi:Putative glycolipid-binding